MENPPNPNFSQWELSRELSRELYGNCTGTVRELSARSPHPPPPLPTPPRSHPSALTITDSSFRCNLSTATELNNFWSHCPVRGDLLITSWVIVFSARPKRLAVSYVRSPSSINHVLASAISVDVNLDHAIAETAAYKAYE